MGGIILISINPQRAFLLEHRTNPIFTNDPIFRSFALKRSSTRILGFKRTTTSLSQIKTLDLAEADVVVGVVTINLPHNKCVLSLA